MILLDTDIMIDLLRGYAPAVDWLESLADEEIVLPGFVVMELIQGCRSRAEQKKLEGALNPYEITWPDAETCDEALAVFSRHHLSRGLGILDALIGQMAVVSDVPLVTSNQKHYAAVPNLKTLQPYKKSS
jgi:hypothetical protein